MSFNWGSVMAKAQACLEKPAVKKQLREKAERYLLGLEVSPGSFSLKEVGEQFAAVLSRSIQAAGLSPNVEDVLLNIKVEAPKKLRNGNYMIPVTFGLDLERETMSTRKPYYPVNLAALYNNGVDHIMKQIFERYGNQKEHLLVSNTYIPRSGFAEDAIRIFTDSYGSKYNLVRIESTFDE